jgi:hypothetical protein
MRRLTVEVEILLCPADQGSERTVPCVKQKRFSEYNANLHVEEA